MYKQSLLNPQITFYIRTAKKLGYIEKSKKQTLKTKQLNQIAFKKTKIPVQNQVLYFNGEQINQNQNVKIIDKSIIHVLDSRNIGKSQMKLLVKRLPQNSNIDSFYVDSNSSIDEFIKTQLSSFYQEPADKLFLVYSGRQLIKQNSFSQQNVQTDTQIICLHEEKDRRNNKTNYSVKSNSNLLNENKTIQHQLNKKKLQVQNNEEKPIQEQPKSGKINVSEVIKQQNQRHHEKQTKQLSGNVTLKSSPLNLLMEQTKQIIHKQHNGSSPSLISEHNFKKKNKVSEVAIINISPQTTNQNHLSQYSQFNNISQGNSLYPSTFDSLNLETDKETKILQRQNEKNQQSKQNVYRTREQIFESSAHTYQSVIDDPEDSISNNNEVKNQGFVSLQNRNENQVYDSQMNYYQQNSSNLELKQHKGFMNFSNTSFLQPSSIERVNQNKNARLNNQLPEKQISIRQVKDSQLVIKNDENCQISVKDQQLLEYSYSISRQNQQKEQNSRRSPTNSYPTRGELLEFDKQQQKIKLTEQSEDNLFVQYKRGSTNNKNNILIHQEQISQSNFLSEIYQQPSASVMNSFTFNLEANPDDIVSNLKLSEVNIVPEQAEEEEMPQVAYSKRQSEVQTDFRDSANCSQAFSSSSQLYANFQNDQQFQPYNPSLIDNLISMVEQKDSIEQQTLKNQNTVKQEQNQNQQSNVFVQYQQYRADLESFNHQVEQCSFTVQYEKPFQNHSYTKNINNDIQVNTIELKQNYSKTLIDNNFSIVQKQLDNNNEESDDCSGAFNQVSQSIQPVQNQYSLINNLAPPENEEITFRKDKISSQSVVDEPQGSKLLYELSLQALNSPQQPQLMPGDYIYSTDLVQTPDETLESILTNFAHCF